MELRPYIDTINRQLALAAEASGDETRVLTERLITALDASLRLTLQDVLAAAADEITVELAPGSVELRLRGRDPEFVVTPPSLNRPIDGLTEGAGETMPDSRRSGDIVPPASLSADDEGAMSRINFRMPDRLKSRIEQAAGREGLSVNAWLVRAATAALERPPPDPRGDERPPVRGQRYTGWAR